MGEKLTFPPDILGHHLLDGFLWVLFGFFADILNIKFISTSIMEKGPKRFNPT